MKKPVLRRESLTDLSGEQLRALAGAAPNEGTVLCSIHFVDVSEDSCVCGFDGLPCNYEPQSDGSCLCTIGPRPR